MQNWLDYYERLEVEKNTSIEEIKNAYRRLARQYHPDLNPRNKVAEEKFKQICEAYEVLSNPNSRVQYDQAGRDWKQGGFQGRLMRRSLHQQKRRDRGSRISMDAVDFGLLPYFNSFVEQLLVYRSKKDNGGTALASSIEDSFRPGTTRSSYTVTSDASRQDIEAQLTISLPKAYVGGYERIRLSDGRSLEVNLPAAMVTDQCIYFKGIDLNADLYLKITVEPHAFWKLEGTDVYCQLPITPCEAVLGGAVEVPTLNGNVKINLPPRVQSGQHLRLASLGYPDRNGRRGDQVIEIQIVVPRNISRQERELYEKLRQIEAFNLRADLPALKEAWLDISKKEVLNASFIN